MRPVRLLLAAALAGLVAVGGCSASAGRGPAAISRPASTSAAAVASATGHGLTLLSERHDVWVVPERAYER